MKTCCSGIASAAMMGVLLGAVAGGCVLVIDGDHDDDWSRSEWGFGNSDRPRIGVDLATLTKTTASQCNIKQGDGCAITGVVRNSPAERAGLQAFDVVTAIDGIPEADEDNLRRAIRSKEWGDAITLSIVRRGQPMDVTVLLEREIDPDTSHGDTNY